MLLNWGCKRGILSQDILFEDDFSMKKIKWVAIIFTKIDFF